MAPITPLSFFYQAPPPFRVLWPQQQLRPQEAFPQHNGKKGPSVAKILLQLTLEKQTQGPKTLKKPSPEAESPPPQNIKRKPFSHFF